MFQGLRTVVYNVADLARAKAWYIEVLGLQPYFDQPPYVGFNVGGYELGLLGIAPDNAPETARSVTYWGVDDADVMFSRMVELGATQHEPIHDVGDEIRLGSVVDPFGNVVGIIKNPQFKLPDA